jgi:hypothetical protein
MENLTVYSIPIRFKKNDSRKRILSVYYQPQKCENFLFPEIQISYQK